MIVVSSIKDTAGKTVSGTLICTGIFTWVAVGPTTAAQHPWSFPTRQPQSKHNRCRCWQNYCLSCEWHICVLQKNYRIIPPMLCTAQYNILYRKCCTTCTVDCNIPTPFPPMCCVPDLRFSRVSRGSCPAILATSLQDGSRVLVEMLRFSMSAGTDGVANS